MICQDGDKIIWTTRNIVPEAPNSQKKKNEPRHDRTNKVTVRPAKTQISLGICPVWSESSLCAQWVAKDPRFLHVDSDDSGWSDWADAQADLSLRWAQSHFVGFVMSQLKYWKLTFFVEVFLLISRWSFCFHINITDMSRDMTKPTKWVYSDQPGHLPSLFRGFVVRMKKAWVLSYPLSAQRRLCGCPG